MEETVKCIECKSEKIEGSWEDFADEPETYRCDECGAEFKPVLVNWPERVNLPFMVAAAYGITIEKIRWKVNGDFPDAENSLSWEEHVIDQPGVVTIYRHTVERPKATQTGAEG